MSIIHRLIPLVPSALALALASHAWAQPAQSAGVAHLQHVTGNVLVSKETGLASGSESTASSDHPTASSTRPLPC